MPASVTVWLVPLGPGAALEGEKGSLEIADDAIRFTPAQGTAGVRRWALADVTRARRLHGSPVLLVASATAHGTERLAFYFVQPPPLEQPEDTLRPGMGGLRRTTKRRVRRRNVTYLGMANRDLRGLLRDWEGRVRAAVEAAKSEKD